MKRMVMVMALACAAMLGGCENGIEKALRAAMKDPGSAQFEGKVEYKNWACISVNSKNSFGGYTGFKRYLLKQTDADWSVLVETIECTVGTMKVEEANEQESQKVQGRVLALLIEKKLIPPETTSVFYISNPACAQAAISANANGQLAFTERSVERRHSFQETHDRLMNEFRQGKCSALTPPP